MPRSYTNYGKSWGFSVILYGKWGKIHFLECFTCFFCLFVQFLLEPRIYSNTVGLLKLEFLKSPTNGEVGGGTLREDVFSKK